ncbi:MAG TPA: apolipoprotein N-acyltransferase [Vicinamibacteria bacterium]|nr:apolipoprotein N-acyltransferase [Vicinamibacteria bacterium]
MARYRPELLAALSGVLLVLSFPKFGHWTVGWIALAPLLLAMTEVGVRRAARLGYLTGTISGVGLLYWTALVVTQFGGLSLPIAALIMLLLCLAVALFPALFAALVASWTAAVGPRALLLAPLAWVATEVLRAYTFFRFPWCLLGYSQADNLPYIQVARFGAVYAVSFLLALSASVLAYAAVERDVSFRRAALLALAAALGLVMLDGVNRLGQAPAESGRLRVGLVQASIPQDEKWDPERGLENVERHVELTIEAARAGARLVVWPESALPWDFERTPEIAGRLRRVVKERGVDLLFGNDDNSADSEQTWVGAKLLTAEGALTFRYHKIRLVPFGEYVPLQPLLTLGGRVAAKLVRQVSDFTPGDSFAIAGVDGGRLSTSICYEAIFPDLLREFVARGSELLVNVTNDGWYGTTSAPFQHFAMARFRAVENGRYLVRAANTGITGVVDARGRVLERTTLFDRTVIVRDVPLIREETFYARRGDVFAWACLGATVSFTAFVLVRRSG